ncbi:hypothetical protein [Salinibacter ruber]|uniref:hypothetical protein n=1 Tax=Salinibacter ruber TaxID=146919 RepID=UPI00216A3932|nr:hypothetical protein [Salinibacter ruber]MCS4051444.1 hypothetical protein [Salinibacter ruber]
MGQQQLLLLVLATVIVGLATVAGIQAFEEGRSQAAQDALQQRALSIAQDIKGAYETPSQLGGISSDPSASDAASAAGLQGTGGVADESTIPVPGAGSYAACAVEDATSNGEIKITCQENEDDTDGSGASVTAKVGSSTDPAITNLSMSS